MIAKDLSEQQEPDADLEVIQQINFTGNLDQTGNTTMFLIIEESKEINHFKFFHKELWDIVNVFHNVFCFDIKWFNIILLNVNFSNPELNKLKSEIKINSEVTPKLSLNVIPTMRLFFLMNYF